MSTLSGFFILFSIFIPKRVGELTIPAKKCQLFRNNGVDYPEALGLGKSNCC